MVAPTQSRRKLGLRAVAAAVAVLAAANAAVSPAEAALAQSTNSEAWLQSNYIHVGVGAYGSFGTEEEPKKPMSALGVYGSRGFICDFQRDGWDVGTPAPFAGDYFLPGKPAEGWVLEFTDVDGIDHNWVNKGLVKNLFGTDFVARDLPAENVEITTQGTTASTLWESTAHGSDGDALHVAQTTSVTDNELFFTITVQLKNVGGRRVDEIDYMRTVDPDQGNEWGQGFETWNYVRYQRAGLGDDSRVDITHENSALVYSEGGLTRPDPLGYNGMILGLGTVSESAIATHYGSGDNADPNEPWINANWKDFTEASPEHGDTGLNLNFRFPSLEPGESKSFTFFYLLDESGLSDASQVVDGALPQCIEHVVDLMYVAEDNLIYSQNCNPASAAMDCSKPDARVNGVEYWSLGTPQANADKRLCDPTNIQALLAGQQ